MISVPLWRGSVAERGANSLSLPQVAALPYEVNNRLTPPSPKSGRDFFVVAEEHIIGLFDHPGRDQVFAEAADAGTEDRPREGEVAGLLFPDDRIPLVDLQQLVELAE